MLQQTTAEVRLADHKQRHQRAGIAVLTAIPTKSRRILYRTALNIASAGKPNYCLLTNWGSSGEFRLRQEPFPLSAHPSPAPAGSFNRRMQLSYRHP